MKDLIIINGTMGVGKTTAGKLLNGLLPKSVWLDGDWCWMMNPWDFSAENKAMVLDNICHLLSNFLQNSSFQSLILTWVIPDQDIVQSIIDRLPEIDFRVIIFTLICSENELIRRRQGDGRDDELIGRSIGYLQLFPFMNSNTIDTTRLSTAETSEEILGLLNNGSVRTYYIREQAAFL